MGELGVSLDHLTGLGVLALVAVLTITRKIVWYTDLRKVEVERDYWRDAAVRALGVAKDLTVQGEVTNRVLSKLPDPDSLADEIHQARAVSE